MLRDGAAAHLRPIRHEDTERLQRMHAGQSESSIYLRYFTYKSELSAEELEKFTHVDHDSRVAMVVLFDEEIIGVGRYDRIPGTEEAEVAFNISDDHQGRGLGSILLEHLAAAGRERGIREFSAEVLPQNRKMLAVFFEAGFEVDRVFEEDVFLVKFPIDPTERSRAVMESREHRAEARSVAELLAPEQIAVVGSSRQYGSVSYHLLQNIIEGHFTGGVHTVSPEAVEEGVGAVYASLDHIQHQIELAVISVPADHLLEVITACGRAGVRGLLIITDGVDAEIPSGMDQRELVRHARRWGMRVIGPASVGMINTDPDVSLNASLSPSMPVRGGVGLFSQSASIGVGLYAQVLRRELGLSAMISAGNRADLSGNDAMQHFEADEATRAVGIYLESFGNPRKFSRIARRLSLSKPVVVTKSDVMGRRLPPGHQVRISRAPHGAVEAMLDNSGVIQAGNHDSMMDVLQVLATQPLPAGARLGILSNSASISRVLADAAESYGLLPTSIVGNLNLEGGQQTSQLVLTAALEQMFYDDDVDIIAVALQPTSTGVHHDYTRAISATAQGHPKPMVLSLIGVLESNVPLNFIGNAGPVIEDGALQQGVPIFSSPARSVAALAKTVNYQQWRHGGIGEPYVPEGLEGTTTARRGEALLKDLLAEAGNDDDIHELSREQASELLGLYGVEVMESAPFDTAEEAVAAAERLGYPVAVKSTNPHLRHRLDLGGVHLNIEDAQMLRRVVADMQRRLARYGTPGLEVQTMAPAGQGCILRAIEDPMMGPVVSFGISGDAVDLLDDWAHAVPPLTDKDVRRLVRGPKAAVKLFGYQGVPSVDVAALEQTVQRVAMLKDNHPEVAELKLTPLLASADGVSILHATVQIANPEQRTDSARRAISEY